MNKLTLIGMFAVVLIAFVGGMLLAKNPSSDSPGLQPYTPSRIEWLALYLNVYDKIDLPDYCVSYNVKDDNTIRYIIAYNKNADAKELIEAPEIIEFVIKTRASQHGWENWVKTEKMLFNLDEKK